MMSVRKKTTKHFTSNIQEYVYPNHNQKTQRSIDSPTNKTNKIKKKWHNDYYFLYDDNTS